MTKPVIEQVRTTTRNAVKKQARQRRAQEKKQRGDDRKMELRERNYVRTTLLKDALAQIKAAASKGEKSVSINIMRWSDVQNVPHLEIRAKYLKDALEKRKFKVERDSSRMDPCGSDPIFFHTVYDMDICVSW